MKAMLKWGNKAPFSSERGPRRRPCARAQPWNQPDPIDSVYLARLQGKAIGNLGEIWRGLQTEKEKNKWVTERHVWRSMGCFHFLRFTVNFHFVLNLLPFDPPTPPLNPWMLTPLTLSPPYLFNLCSCFEATRVKRGGFYFPAAGLVFLTRT